MLFNSWLFPPFLLVVLALYYRLQRRGQNVMLLLASYFFYACWDWRFLGLLLLSTGVDWTLANWISRAPTRAHARRFVATSVLVNLLFLGFFKYFNFFIDSADALLQALGLQPLAWHMHIVLPVGISFYTFQSISYIVDVYRGEVEPARDPLDFALFVAFFPHMVAGPIMHSRDLLPQIQKPRQVTRQHLREAAWLMLYGFFKKLVVGDNLAPLVNGVYAQPDASGSAVLLATYAFAFQIYCDFSGYTDIARGCAKLMGIELMLNFDRPYLATNPSDFWRRWHISLSTWLRDYLYVPLGGNRLGALLTHRNLALTMLLGGLWHGAAWNFVLWGAYHGLLLIVHRLFTRDLRSGVPSPPSTPALAGLRRVGAQLLMFHATCYGWLLFRATSLEQCLNFTRALFSGFEGLRFHALVPPLVALGAAVFLIDLWVRNADDPGHSPGWRAGFGACVCTLMALAVVLLAPPGTQSFIYFQF
jgi:D-alanyl-lipoteichoic acid acyltransferase DltB (MBOAT superfamily)